MKYVFLVFVIVLSSINLFAQQGNEDAVPPPLPLRQVSGIVKDETGQPLPGVNVLLVSIKDTLKIPTDINGIFVFREVKRATFLITVTGVGITTITKKYFNNDLAKKIVLDPISTKPNIKELGEVKIDGRPTIIYKPDTVEYKANDYKVRENATVDELLKKMDGVEVGRDGSVTYQGQAVIKAKLNGKDFAGGNVAQAVKNLPAEIMDKVQFIDDYGDQAARTGIKDGAPAKILNLTTKADRSIGTYGSLTLQGGNDDRFSAKLAAFHLNANQTIALIGRLDNTVNGVASDITGVHAGSPGTTRSGAPSISYSDQWSKKIVVLTSYTYRFDNNNSDNQSYGQVYSYGQNSSVRNTSSFNRQSTTQNSNQNHNLSFAMDYNVNKLNFFKITPTFSSSNSTHMANSFADYLNNFTTGFEHINESRITDNQNNVTTYGIGVLYQHIFIKPGRNFSVQASVNNSVSKTKGDNYTDYNYFADSTENHSLRDSTAHLLTNRSSNNIGYNASVTYSEPLNDHSRLEFTGRMNRTVYDNKAISDTVLANGQIIELYRLDNIFNYSFTEARAAMSYSYRGTKLNFSLGISAVPSILAGNKVDNNTGATASSTINDFKAIPVFSLSYAVSQTERFSLSYSGGNSEPNFQEIQPFTDKSDPNNIIVGNPNLKPSFNNTVIGSYNKYYPNSKLTYGLNINASNYINQASTNIIQVAELISTSPNRYKTVNEVHYVNLNGSKSLGGNYSISKRQSDDFYLSLNGKINYGYNTAESNNIIYHITSWRLNERFGPGISIGTGFEINPYVAYDISKAFTSLPGAVPTNLQTTSLAIDGKIYFLKHWQINYNAAKNYIVGLQNFNSNPLIINVGFERTFLERKNLVFTFNAYDILHQNNFIQQNVNAQGVTNTFSSTSSRYFLVGLHLILQKWSGKPERDGKALKRRGDGSFIY
jgi:hypothetical protein